jgi:hypothetical protein
MIYRISLFWLDPPGDFGTVQFFCMQLGTMLNQIRNK